MTQRELTICIPCKERNFNSISWRGYTDRYLAEIVNHPNLETLNISFAVNYGDDPKRQIQEIIFYLEELLRPIHRLKAQGHTNIMNIVYTDLNKRQPVNPLFDTRTLNTQEENTSITRMQPG